MIRAELKRLLSPDVPDLKSYRPNSGDFGILVQAIYGPEGEEGEESFDFVVCTPSWLAGQVKTLKIMNGRDHLIVDRFDFAELTNYLSDHAKRSSATTWKEVAGRLSTVGRWEFDDYREI